VTVTECRAKKTWDTGIVNFPKLSKKSNMKTANNCNDPFQSSRSFKYGLATRCKTKKSQLEEKCVMNSPRIGFSSNK
jgi:hypothetical protein